MSQAKLQALLQNSLHRRKLRAGACNSQSSFTAGDEHILCICAVQGPALIVMPAEQTPGTPRNSRCAQLAVLFLTLPHLIPAEALNLSNLRAKPLPSAIELRQDEPTTTAAANASESRRVCGVFTLRVNGGKLIWRPLYAAMIA